MDPVIVVGIGLASLVLGIVVGVGYAAERATQGTTDLLLAAIYLYAEKTYDSKWRQEFIEAVGEYMIAHEPLVKAMATMLAKERKAGKL